MGATDSKPLVSIGLPVYNGERSIRQALDSIVDQTYENLEIIICDNASRDETGRVCLQYAARDTRIGYYRNSRTIGVIANYRRVVELASGEYFMWAAADDVKPLNIVETCLQALLRNTCAVMAHGPILVKAEGREDLLDISNEMDLSDPRPAQRIRTFTNRLQSQGILYGLYRRNALAKAVFPNSYGQEYLLCLQMCLLGPVEYVRTPMIVYRARKPILPNNPMYMEAPVTLIKLLTDSGVRRRKCWTVLLLGCYYLCKMRGIGPWERVSAISAHAMTFGWIYRARFSKEILFLLFTPVSWLGYLVWDLARRWQLSFLVARKLKSMITRAY